MGDHSRGPGGRIAGRLLELWKAATRSNAKARDATEGRTARRVAMAVWRRIEECMVEAIVVVLRLSGDKKLVFLLSSIESTSRRWLNEVRVELSGMQCVTVCIAEDLELPCL